MGIRRKNRPIDNKVDAKTYYWRLDMDNLELDIDKKISPEDLDVEALQIPQQYLKWAERASEARGLVDDTELALETIKAELDLKIRRSPEKYHLDKPTEAAVKAKVITMPRYLEAHQAYNRARLESARAVDAVKTMEKKDAMLKLLVQLHGQAYFAGPSTPRNLKEMYQKQLKAVEDRVNKKQTSLARKRT